MKISLRSSADRQSTSLAGRAELASADLRRWFSRCSLAAILVLAAAATFSSTALACCLLPRTRPSRKLPSSDETTCPTIRDAAGVPSTSLVWPSNCGSGSRTEITTVRPSSTSSLTTGSSAALSNLVAFSCSLTVLSSARSNPVTCVPPLGVAITLTNDLVIGVVAAVPAQRDVDGQVSLDFGRREMAEVIEHGHGLGELAGAGQPEHVGDRRAGAQVRAELADAAFEAELDGLGLARHPRSRAHR